MLGWPAWVGVVSEDLERQRAFYRDVLGFEESSSGSDFVMFQIDGRSLELLRRSDLPQYRQPGVAVGFVVADIFTAREELIGRGVEAVTGVEGPSDGQYWAYFRDPEGNLFELVQRTDASGSGRDTSAS